MNKSKPILRIFEVITKENCAEKMLDNFEQTSSKVVQGEPGNLGFYFGRNANHENESVVFVSVWKDLESVKNKFGEHWRDSYLPEGYEDIIETHSLKHIEAIGWAVNL